MTVAMKQAHRGHRQERRMERPVQPRSPPPEPTAGRRVCINGRC